MGGESGSAGAEGADFDPGQVRFVLVEPRHGGNVGATARALKNLGFLRLVLVRPVCDPLGVDARRMAVEAGDLLERAQTHDRLDEALGDAGTVVGTSRRTGKHRQPNHRLDQISSELVVRAGRGGLALMFGREDRGLTDAELDRATHLVHLPASDLYPSFNLSQAVLLVAYELRRAVVSQAGFAVLPMAAGHTEREAMYHHLQRALEAIGFLHEDSREPIMRRLRRMFGRATMTREEVKMLRGVARQVLWLSRHAGVSAAAEAREAGEDDSAAANDAEEPQARRGS